MCSVTWGEHRPDYYRYLIDAEDCPRLDAHGLSGASADPARWPARLIR